MWLSNKHTHTRMPRERRFINNSNMPQTTFAYMLVQKKTFFMLKMRKQKREKKLLCLFIFFHLSCLILFAFWLYNMCLCVCVWFEMPWKLAHYRVIPPFSLFYAANISKSDLCTTVEVCEFLILLHHVLSSSFYVPSSSHIHRWLKSRHFEFLYSHIFFHMVMQHWYVIKSW